MEPTGNIYMINEENLQSFIENMAAKFSINQDDEFVSPERAEELLGVTRQTFLNKATMWGLEISWVTEKKFKVSKASIIAYIESKIEK